MQMRTIDTDARIDNKPGLSKSHLKLEFKDMSHPRNLIRCRGRSQDFTRVLNSKDRDPEHKIDAGHHQIHDGQYYNASNLQNQIQLSTSSRALQGSRIGEVISPKHAADSQTQGVNESLMRSIGTHLSSMYKGNSINARESEYGITDFRHQNYAHAGMKPDLNHMPNPNHQGP